MAILAKDSFFWATTLARNELEFHGWVYQFETGKVFGYDSEQERFLPIDATVD